MVRQLSTPSSLTRDTASPKRSLSPPPRRQPSSPPVEAFKTSPVEGDSEKGWVRTLLSPSLSPPPRGNDVIEKGPVGRVSIASVESHPRASPPSLVKSNTERDGSQSHSESSGYQSPPIPPRLERLDSHPDYRQSSLNPTSRSRSLSDDLDLAPAQKVLYPTPISVAERHQWPDKYDKQLRLRQQPLKAPPILHSVLPHDERVWAPATPQHFSYQGDWPSDQDIQTTKHSTPRAQDVSKRQLSRPRLSIHPYAVPPSDSRQRNQLGGVGALRGINGIDADMRRIMSSPASSVSPGNKAPRKRADDAQLAILGEVFERTSYPSTEERDSLARQLGMTSRSVQIWFQNRRRAVKVEQISAQQRAEAEALASQRVAHQSQARYTQNAAIQRHHEYPYQARAGSLDIRRSSDESEHPASNPGGMGSDSSVKIKVERVSPDAASRQAVRMRDAASERRSSVW